ncbi:hypothetical protein AKJ16_DCAP00853, partial [Drosera capensis]
MLALRRRSSQPANFFYPLETLLDLPVYLFLPLWPRFNRTFSEGGRLLHQLHFPSLFATRDEISGWRKIDAMEFGFKLSMIPESYKLSSELLKKEECKRCHSSPFICRPAGESRQEGDIRGEVAMQRIFEEATQPK